MHIWPILGVLAIICLIISFFLKRHVIWGGFVLGAIIATITAIKMKHDVINSSTSKKIIVACVLIGAFFELIDRLAVHNSPEKRMEREIKRAEKRIGREVENSLK